MYVKVNNQAVEKFPYSIGDLRRDNPNTSFPKNPSQDLLAEWGVYRVSASNPPAKNPNQVIEQNDEPTYTDGSWVIGYTARDMTPDEVNDLGDAARNSRNAKLSESDWTQIADSPLSDSDRAAWGTYRQALRDVTDHAGFPFEINWPTAP